MLILSDDYAVKDRIGHTAYCDGLIDVIRSVDANGSFTIGVYGQWGVGKTSLLKQIKECLDAPSENGSVDFLTVWFNPWQFVADEHLVIPFFHVLTTSLYSDTKKTKAEKIKNNLHVFLKKIAHVPLALVYGMVLRYMPHVMFFKFSLHQS